MINTRIPVSANFSKSENFDVHSEVHNGLRRESERLPTFKMISCVLSTLLVCIIISICKSQVSQQRERERGAAKAAFFAGIEHKAVTELN